MEIIFLEMSFWYIFFNCLLDKKNWWQCFKIGAPKIWINNPWFFHQQILNRLNETNRMVYSKRKLDVQKVVAFLKNIPFSQLIFCIISVKHRIFKNFQYLETNNFFSIRDIDLVIIFLEMSFWEDFGYIFFNCLLDKKN